MPSGDSEGRAPPLSARKRTDCRLPHGHCAVPAVPSGEVEPTQGAAVEFRVLGPIEVICEDGESLGLGGSRSRALLAALLLDAGVAVTRETLIDALWESPPASASHSLEVLSSRLRRAVGRGTAIREMIELDSEQFDEVIGVEAPLVLALVASQESEPSRAVEIWAASERRRREIGYAIGHELTAYVDDLLEPLRARDEFEAEWERGTALTPDDAITLGLRTT